MGTADPPALLVSRGATLRTEPRAAALELARELGDGSGLVLFFCSSEYDLERLGPELAARFRGPIVGCTTAGELGPSGFQKGGMVAVRLTSPYITARTYAIRGLADCAARVSEIAEQIRIERERSSLQSKAFGLLLVDGLSMMEEPLASALYQSLGDIPIVGGSAGDDLRFVRTHVYVDGAFVSDAAVLTIFETILPFVAFKAHHFTASGRKLVVTSADNERRRIRELNGEPAAVAYARAIGCSLEQLDAHVCASFPLLVNIDGEQYIRSIATVNPDHSLTLFCAIDEGLVLSLGESQDPIACVSRAFDSARRAVGTPELVIACDCILRRLELEYRGLDQEIGRLYADNKVIGFSTYGEQYNSIHVNQTFTGIAVGSRKL